MVLCHFQRLFRVLEGFVDKHVDVEQPQLAVTVEPFLALLDFELLKGQHE